MLREGRLSKYNTPETKKAPKIDFGASYGLRAQAGLRVRGGRSMVLGWKVRVELCDGKVEVVPSVTVHGRRELTMVPG
jgi:hypothetical protein